jgi:hypothetical protein
MKLGAGRPHCNMLQNARSETDYYFKVYRAIKGKHIKLQCDTNN